jgi:hypothetical protein
VRSRRYASVFVLNVLLVAIRAADAQPSPAGNPTAPSDSGPRLVITPKEWNFGQVWHADPCKTEVELRNAGDATLRIINVKSSCGCTAARPSKRELAPGETDRMEVSYDTTRLKKKILETITIETNDPVAPEIKFRVRGEVWHVFDASPFPVIGFGLMRPESEKTEAIELTSNVDAPVSPRIKRLEPQGLFEVKVEKIEAGKKYRVVARTKPPLALGVNRATLVLETGVERLPTMSIPVTAIVLDRVSVRPDHLRVVPSQTQGGPRMLRVNYTEQQPIEITEIKSSHPSVKVYRVPARRTPPGKTEFAAHELRVTVPSFAEFPEEGVRIEIYTNDRDPKFQKFVVPIEKIYPGKSPTKKASLGPGEPAGKPD